MYVLENICANFTNTLKANTEKPVIIYDGKDNLIQSLCKIYETNYNEALRQSAKNDLIYIKSVLEKLAYYSSISTEELFLLEFYSKYMTNLSDRRKYFETLEKTVSFFEEKKDRKEIFCICPRGNYKYICEDEKLKNAKIIRVFDNASYGYANCIFKCKKEKNY